MNSSQQRDDIQLHHCEQFGPIYHQSSLEPKQQSESNQLFPSDLSGWEYLDSQRQHINQIRENILSCQKQEDKVEAKALGECLVTINKLPILSPEQSNEEPFLKTLLRQGLLHKFKNKLLDNAYIIPKNSIQVKQKKISDFMNFENDEQEQSYCYRLIDKLKCQVFQPSSVFIRIWDVLGIAVCILILWYCALISSFSMYTQSKGHEMQLVIIMYIITDSIITLNKGIIIQGEVILSRITVMKQYISAQLVGDCLTLLFWLLTYFYGTNSIGYLYEVSLVCQIWFVIQKVNSKYQVQLESLSLKGIMNAGLDLLVLVVSIYMFAHFLACTWHYIGVQSEYLGKSWIITYQLVNESMWVRYNYSFYWATMTMVTVGYGDISAQNNIEVLCSSIMMFISSVVFAYTMNSIGLILKSLYDQKSQYNRQLALINDYMIYNEVNYQMQSRVRSYLKYCLNQVNESNQEEVNKVISNLPDTLRNDLQSDIQMRSVKQITILTQLFSNQTIELLSKELEIVKFTPNEIIFHENDNNQSNLYFLIKGQVKLFEERTKKVLQTIEPQESFGEFQFFTGQCSKTAAVSVNFTEAIKISNQQMQSIVRNNAKDFELFFNIKDQLLYNSNYECINRNCNICKKQDHETIDCPCLSYKPNLEFLIKKEYFLKHDSRGKVKRKDYRAKNSRRVQALNELAAQQLENDNEEYFNQQNQNMSNIVTIYRREKQQETVQSQEVKHNTYYQSKNRQSMGYEVNKLKVNEDVRINSIAVLDKYEDCQTPKLKSALFSQPEVYSQLDQFKHHLVISLLKTDKLQYYLNYMPQNNVDMVLKQYNLKLVKKLQCQYLAIANKYSIYQKVKEKSSYLRKYFSNLLSKQGDLNQNSKLEILGQQP